MLKLTLKNKNKFIKLISEIDDEIKTSSWMDKESKQILESQNNLTIELKTKNINNLIQAYSLLKKTGSLDKKIKKSFNNNALLISEDKKNKFYSQFSQSNVINDLSNKNERKGFFENFNSCFKCSGKSQINSCISCKKPICQNCTGKCKNKNPSHHSINTYCEDCLKVCSLCGINILCLSCSKKCFNKNCNFYFCLICSEKNKHQQRPENANCKFYNCESCNSDGCCIMATIYCNSCDKRVCRNCLKKSHLKHLNFN